MGNFWVDTLWPWLRFEPSGDPLGLREPADGLQSSGVGLASLGYGAMPANGGEAVGLSNWQPANAPAAPQAEPQPWWLVPQRIGDEFKFEPNSPWLHVRPPDGPPGFRVAPDGTVASGQAVNGTAFGLDRQAPNVGPVAPSVGGLFAQQAMPRTEPPVETQPWWSRPPGHGDGLNGRPDLRWPWLRAEPMDESPGFGVARDGSAASGQTGNGTAFGLDWRARSAGSAAPFGSGLFTQQASSLTEPPVDTQPWWSRLPGQGEGLDGRSDLRWPWLRAEPMNEPPGFRVNRDGSGDQSKSDDFSPMSFAYQPFGQAMQENIAADGTQSPAGAAQTPLNPSQQSAGVDGLTAASMAVPMAPAMAGSEAARAALAEVAALAGRVAPAAARAASGPAAALSILVTPANSQGETIDLGDGLRARISPGQRSVEIERRADNGLFGTGIGARWETLPVDAELHVEEGGAASVVIDQQQLHRAVGPDAAARALEASGSAMARPPKKGKGDDTQPPAGIGHNSGQVPDPEGGPKPPLGPNALTTLAEGGIKALEHSNRPTPFDAQTEQKLLDERRQVMKAHRQQAPDGHYRDDDGFQTAVGIRMHPSLPDPSAGRDYSPDPKDAHLLKGYIGELELANRIALNMRNEVVVHYGNPAGQRGPDVVSVSSDGVFTVWESKYRTAERSTGPSNVPAQTENSFKTLQHLAMTSIRNAMAAGRLAPEVAAKALKNAEDGNFIIATVGTGNAHEGLVEFVQNRTRPTPRR